MSPTSLSLALLLAAASVQEAKAQDWPHYRGPQRDGVAAPQPIRPSWPEGGPSELWRRPLGAGFSTVVSVGDRLYTMGASETEEEVHCLDARTGQAVWTTALGPRFEEEFGDGPRATPTVFGDTVFAVSSTMQLAALDLEDGAPRWQRNLLEEFGIEQPRFGFAASVFALEDQAILEIGAGEGQAVASFDPATGDVLWTALDGPASPSSPVLVELAGEPQLVYNRRAGMAGLSLDGTVLWTHPCAADVIVMAQFVAPDRLFTSSATMGRGGVMVRVTKEDGEYRAEDVWASRRFRNHFNDAVLVDGHLYGFDNSTLRCVDAETGAVRWSERGLGKGSLIACGSKLFVLGDQGSLVLVDATPEAFVERGRVQALEGRCWTSPSLASGRLLLRSLDEIVAYDVAGALTDPLAQAAPTPAAGAAPADLEVPALEQILAGYERARGGRDRWAEVETLELSGSFSAFSERSPFLLRRQRDNLFRFDFGMVGRRDVRAHDGEDLWWRYGLFGITEPSRVAMDPYRPQLQRESMFEPPLMNAKEKGIEVSWVGVGEVNGQPCYDLKLQFLDETEEIWHLHPGTLLELAVDSTVVDMTQGRDPMDCRTFYSDFREVEGLVLPFAVAAEFGARLEERIVEKVLVDPEFPAGSFAMVAGEEEDVGEEDGEGGGGEEEDGGD